VRNRERAARGTSVGEIEPASKVQRPRFGRGRTVSKKVDRTEGGGVVFLVLLALVAATVLGLGALFVYNGAGDEPIRSQDYESRVEACDQDSDPNVDPECAARATAEGKRSRLLPALILTCGSVLALTFAGAAAIDATRARRRQYMSRPEGAEEI
jgi:hypothetical protein